MLTQSTRVLYLLAGLIAFTIPGMVFAGSVKIEVDDALTRDPVVDLPIRVYTVDGSYDFIGYTDAAGKVTFTGVPSNVQFYITFNVPSDPWYDPYYETETGGPYSFTGFINSLMILKQLDPAF